jgi:hypothetical protein
MKSYAQQASLRSKIHAQIEHCALNVAVDDTLNFPGVFLEEQKIVIANERHCDWRDEISNNLSNFQVRREHCWPNRLRPGSLIGLRIETDRQC